MILGRCCTPQEFHFNNRCIKPQKAPSSAPGQAQPSSPQTLHSQLEMPRIHTGTVESLTIDHFAVDGNQIPAGNTQQLDHLASLLKTYKGVEVRIEGHTDSTFTTEYNQKLSEQRAKSVAGALIKRGVDASCLRVEGFGKTHLSFDV